MENIKRYNNIERYYKICDTATSSNYQDFLDLLKSAETLKEENKSVKTYTYSVKPDVVVISNDDLFLKKFEDTYSGVLNVISIYISEKTNNDFYTASEFEITGGFPEYTVNVKVFSPIDFEKCVWCGKCYITCPEQCIDLDLNIDFSKCTFCGECEKVCEFESIQIKLINELSINASFIVIDNDDLKNEFAKIGVELFGADEIDKLFERVGEYQVEELVLHENEICQYSPKLGIGCRRCLQACKYDALYVDDNGIKVNHLLCVGCGGCISVCPTGAMQNGYFKDDVFIKYFQTLQLTEDVILLLGDEENIRKFLWSNHNKSFEKSYPIPVDPKFLNVMHYLFLFSIGVAKLYLLNDKLADKNEVKFVNSFIKFLFGYYPFIEFIEKYDEYSEKSYQNPLENKYNNFSFSSRRKKLAAILKFLYENSEKRNVLLKDNILDIFGNVLLDKDRCTLCLACVNHCKIGALLAKETDYTLNHNPSICIQCRICEKVCPEEAIEVASGLLLADEFFELKVLNKDEPMVCPGCGKVFGNKKSYNAVKEKLSLAGLFEVKGKYLNYCETCRVKMLFGEEKDAQ
ncbi:4Fe-4S dicluster domain-containing protein [Deferribacter autotrophicus]|uniref:4Fe-4S dicluster domain-containing protein n=1 Tax=Deferribacter autotrophicus TaxID=500465 RepID=A0A5A8F2E0_9BACT|nr:4Fe-4S binding protein [Deferribacter autotrophicus]KAA0258112.1 4Fe-4S dicluster domain-containing protein [Deferribacter autotrophicus]